MDFLDLPSLGPCFLICLSYGKHEFLLYSFSTLFFNTSERMLSSWKFTTLQGHMVHQATVKHNLEDPSRGALRLRINLDQKMATIYRVDFSGSLIHEHSFMFYNFLYQTHIRQEMCPDVSPSSSRTTASVPTRTLGLS